MSEPCVFCGQPWVPNHSAVCVGRPTKENKIAAAHRYLGIRGGQANDPMLQDPKVLDYLVKRKQAYIRELDRHPLTNLPGRGPGYTWVIHDSYQVAVFLYAFWMVTFVLVCGAHDIFFGIYSKYTLVATLILAAWKGLSIYDKYTCDNHPLNKAARERWEAQEKADKERAAQAARSGQKP